MIFTVMGISAADQLPPVPRIFVPSFHGENIMAQSIVSQPPAASATVARTHFAARLSLETDCADVHEAMTQSGGLTPDFILLDVRGPKAYARAHVPGALNLPHQMMTAERMLSWPAETLFVVYCAGPHCNGADRAALRLAELGRPVKLMLGGMTGWADEGFAYATGDAPGSALSSP
jgi:rhodanese-related sulfurtransferase